MTCRECELLLPEQPGVVAEGLQDDALQQHLDTCAECRALARELAGNAAALAAMREEFVPEPVEAARPAAAAPWGFFLVPRWSWAFAPVVLALIMVVLFVMSRRGGDTKIRQVEVAEMPGPAVAIEAGEVAATPLPAPREKPAPAVVAPSDGTAAVEPRVEVAAVEAAEAGAGDAEQEELLPAFEPDVLGPPGEVGSDRQMLVKMLTPDPDVVIYWLVDDPPASGSEGEKQL